MGTLPGRIRTVRQRVDPELHIVRQLFLWAFALRFAAGFAGWLLTRVAHLPFFQDAFFYEELGNGIAQDWLGGRSSEWLSVAMNDPRAPWLLPFVIGCFYWLVGGLRLVPLLLAAFCSLTSWTPVIVYRIARQLGLSVSGALFAGRLVAFSPAFAFWSGALYKEGLILLLVALGLLHILKLQRRLSWTSLLVVCGCLAGLFGLRFYIAAMMSGILCMGLVFGRRSRRKNEDLVVVAVRQLLIVAGFSAVMVLFGLTERVRAVLPSDFSEALQTMNNSRQDLAQSAQSGFARDANYSTPAEAVEFLPIGLAYFLFSPAPWQFGQIRQNLVIPETAFWVCLYPMIVWGIQRGLRKNLQGSVLLLTAAIAMTFLYALFAGNIGTVYRMRIQVWLVLSIFAGWAWEVHAHKQLSFRRRNALRLARARALALARQRQLQASS